MKAYILYILSGTAGLMLRTGISSLYGLPYTMNGRDIFNALLALVFCYWGRVIARKLIRYDLSEDFSIETALIIAELYRHNGEWKFNAVGAGYQGGLEAICRGYGVNV